MTPRRIALVLALCVAPTLAAQAPQPFPHAKHARLFPTCAGCHGGIPAGDAARSYPAPAVCTSCHDGKVQKAVTYRVPAPRGAGLLTFSHPAHLAKASDATCTSCHATAGAAWMNVAAAAPDRCTSCHAHSAAPHLDAANKCQTCHRPLAAATALADSRVAALPKPPTHADPAFVRAHGDAAKASTAQCATCHARESCARCHVDAGRSRPIQSLAPDARVARLVAGRAPTYPVPASHTARDFGVTHGALARAGTANCATCHARSSCATCHTGNGARDVIGAMPGEGEAAAPGVQLRREPVPPAAGQTLMASWMPQAHADTVRKVRVHQAGFARSHGTAAAAGALDCAGCHAKTYCATCHTGERMTRGFHPANFVAVHAPQAYGRDTDCASCHNTQAFCKSCHVQSGLSPAASTARSTVFHNAQPLWLMQHGRAARQDLPSCTTCHQQSYCMQCHSQLGARINPHGPGFDARAMQRRNPRVCLTCHLANPLAP